MKLTYIKQGAEPVGDGGDQYTGLDRFGRVIDQRWIKNNGAALERVDYGYSRASNRQWRWNRVAANGQDEYYNYDGLYQVKELQRGTLNSAKTSISGTPTWEEDFTYDPIGNWNGYLTKVSGVTDLDQERTHNQVNETTEIDGSAATVGHDAAGNMTKVPQTSDWEATNGVKWDAWNRLVEVVDGDATVAEYRYDGLTRRATKTTDATRHYYYSDQWQIVEERVGAAATADRQFVWGQRYMDDLVLRDRGSERLYVLHDYFNPTAVVAPNGTVLERYGYDAFGLSRVMTPAFNPRASSNYDWETRYGAYRWDAETGFYQVRYRYLHPNLGRWVSRDPLRLSTSKLIRKTPRHLLLKASDSDHQQDYEYVLNNALNAVDSFGLLHKKEILWACDHPKCANAAFDFTRKVTAKMEREFPGVGNQDNTKENAVKHCTWMCSISSWPDCGAELARQLGQAHEDYDGNPTDSKEMDLANNEVGISLGETFKGDMKQLMDPKDSIINTCFSKCQGALANDSLHWIE